MRLSATACACQLQPLTKAHLAPVEQLVAVAEEEYRPNDDGENCDGDSDSNGGLLTLVGTLLFSGYWWWCLGANSFPERDRAGTAKVVVGGLHLDTE